MVLWPYICLEVCDFEGTPPHPPLQGRGAGPWQRQCHRHTAGYRKGSFHPRLVETEIAVPFIKQPGNTYPNSNTASLIEPSRARMTTGLFTTASFVVTSLRKPCYTQPRNSRQSGKRKNAGISTTNHRYERKKQDADREIKYDLMFTKQ